MLEITVALESSLIKDNFFQIYTPSVYTQANRYLYTADTSIWVSCFCYLYPTDKLSDVCGYIQMLSVAED